MRVSRSETPGRAAGRSPAGSRPDRHLFRQLQVRRGDDRSEQSRPGSRAGLASFPACRISNIRSLHRTPLPVHPAAFVIITLAKRERRVPGGVSVAGSPRHRTRSHVKNVRYPGPQVGFRARFTSQPKQSSASGRTTGRQLEVQRALLPWVSAACLPQRSPAASGSGQ